MTVVLNNPSLGLRVFTARRGVSLRVAACHKHANAGNLGDPQHDSRCPLRGDTFCPTAVRYRNLWPVLKVAAGVETEQRTTSDETQLMTA